MIPIIEKTDFLDFSDDDITRLGVEVTKLEADFFVNTTRKHFQQWLERYSVTWREHSFYTQKGRGQWQKAEPYGRDYSRPGLFCINALIHYPGEIVPVRIIEIEIITLTPESENSPGRIEVKMSCSQLNWGRGYFEQMLLEIEKRWPEVGEVARNIEDSKSMESLAEGNHSHLAGTTKPAHPPISAPHDEWFRWYHNVTDELGYRMSLKELADEMSLSYGYVRRLNQNYLAQFRTEK